MSYQYPDISDNGKTISNFSTSGGWKLDSNGTISVDRLAEASAMGIKNNGESEENRVACAIIYNGKVYFGKSNHGIKRTDLPKALQDAMRQRSVEEHSVVNCAEIQAMVAVVAAGYDPQQMGQGLKLHACRTDTGTPVPPCANCTMLLVGAEQINT